MPKSPTAGSSSAAKFFVAFATLTILAGIVAILYVNRPQATPVVSSANSTNSDGSAEQSVAREASTPPNPRSRIVVAISIDGLNSDAFGKINAQTAPHLDKLRSQGTSTLNARTSAQSTETLPNHAGMLTGREVNGPQGHGVTRNDDNGSTIGADTKRYVPSVFDIVHDNGLSTAFYAEKPKFAYLSRSWNKDNGAPDKTGPDNGVAKVDHAKAAKAAELVPLVASDIADQKTDFIFLHLDRADKAGHDHGWMSSQYETAIGEIDGHLGALLDAAEKSKRPVSFVITSDHGGAAGQTRHKKADDLANARIPFITYGDGIGKSKDLYASNPARKNPSDELAQDAQARPIRNIDLANTVLGLLGLPQTKGTISSSWPALALT